MSKEKQENELEPSINAEGKTDLEVEQKDGNLVSETAKKISFTKKVTKGESKG